MARNVDQLACKTMNQHRKRSDDANAFLPDPGEGPARVEDDLAELGDAFDQRVRIPVGFCVG